MKGVGGLCCGCVCTIDRRGIMGHLFGDVGWMCAVDVWFGARVFLRWMML